MDYRIEKDLLSSRQLPTQALFGIYTLRAIENFPLSGRPIDADLIHAYGMVKLAALRTNDELGCWDDREKVDAMAAAMNELISGTLDKHILVDALQGGAGTSTNMNVNEVVANRALQILGQSCGDYTRVHPIDDVNRHQSTNDTYPTALRIAAISKLHRLEQGIITVLAALQDKEKAFAHVVKVGRTQLQDAVPITLGREMGAYAEAFARDRWRIHKCEERLRTINLGATAIGTGIGAPRAYIFRVTEHLRKITGLGLARAENLVDATQNLDQVVEASGMIRTMATNLLKVSGDLRLLSSGPSAGIGEITLEAHQTGSSLMPGKVNPVLPEALCQCALEVLANDHALSLAAGMGNLELNHLLPFIADKLLGSLNILIGAMPVLTRTVQGIRANEEECARKVHTSVALVTALVEKIGYQAAEEIAKEVLTLKCSVRELVLKRELMSGAEFDELTSPEHVTKLGFNNIVAMPKRAHD